MGDKKTDRGKFAGLVIGDLVMFSTGQEKQFAIVNRVTKTQLVCFIVYAKHGVIQAQRSNIGYETEIKFSKKTGRQIGGLGMIKLVHKVLIKKMLLAEYITSELKDIEAIPMEKLYRIVSELRGFW